MLVLLLVVVGIVFSGDRIPACMLYAFTSRIVRWFAVSLHRLVAGLLTSVSVPLGRLQMCSVDAAMLLDLHFGMQPCC